MRALSPHRPDAEIPDDSDDDDDTDLRTGSQAQMSHFFGAGAQNDEESMPTTRSNMQEGSSRSIDPDREFEGRDGETIIIRKKFFNPVRTLPFFR